MGGTAGAASDSSSSTSSTTEKTNDPKLAKQRFTKLFDEYWNKVKGSEKSIFMHRLGSEFRQALEASTVEDIDPKFDIRLDGITQILIHLNPVSGGLFWV